MKSLEDRLASAIVVFLKEIRDDNIEFKKELEAAGISVGFLAGCMAGNMDEYITKEIEYASQIGELYCPKCDEFFNYTQVNKNSGNNPRCLKCNNILEKNTCSECYESLYRNGIYQGIGLEGYIYCPICVQRVKLSKQRKG